MSGPRALALGCARAGMAAGLLSGAAVLAQTAPAAPARPASAPPAQPAPQQVVVEARPISDADLRRDSLLPMTVVGRDELDQHGDTSVLDVLQRLPGITLDGEQPRLRGMGGGYTLVLLNGEPAPPGFSLDSLAPGDIERIEIVKGPTAEHGGVAGTINVILRGAPALRQREARASVGYRALAPQASLRLSAGDRLGALGYQLPLTLSNWRNAATSTVQRVSRPPGAARREDRVAARDEWRGGGLNFAPRLDWKPGPSDTLQGQAFLQRNESASRSRRRNEVVEGSPPVTVDETAGSDSVWQMQRLQVQWTRRQPDGTRWELKGSAQGTLSRAAGGWVGRDAVQARTAERANASSQRERRQALGARLRLPWGSTQALQAGWDLEDRHRRELRRLVEDSGGGPVERRDGSTGQPFAAQVQRAVAFVQHEWVPDAAWSLLAGVRAEQLRITTEGRGETVLNAPSAVTPLLHLRRAFDPKGRQVLRASLSQSIRVPDVGLLLPRYALNGSYERDLPNTPLAADAAGNPRLQPERATGAELAYETQLDGGGVASAGFFHRRIEGLVRRRIALENVAEAPVPRWVSRPVNLGRAHSSGLEFELKGRAAQLFAPRAGRASALQLRAALSVYRSRVEQIDDPDARLEGQAPWQATLGFDDRVAGTGISYGANLALTPAFSTQQSDRQRVWRGAQRRLDAFVGWRVDRTLQWRLAASNLWPADLHSASSVADLDGFAASTATRRAGVAQFTAHAVLSF